MGKSPHTAEWAFGGQDLRKGSTGIPQIGHFGGVGHGGFL